MVSGEDLKAALPTTPVRDLIETIDAPKIASGKVRELYDFGSKLAAKAGIILADTKFEFGTDESGKIYLIDEVLPPDSSRYWDAAEYKVDSSPASFDKQIIRDYLETLKDWNKTAPGLELPQEIIDQAQLDHLRHPPLQPRSRHRPRSRNQPPQASRSQRPSVNPLRTSPAAQPYTANRNPDRSRANPSRHPS